MLKQRILTAFILIPCVLFIIFYTSYGVLAGCLGLLVGGMSWEWSALIPISRMPSKVAFVFLLALLVSPMYWFLSIGLKSALLFWLVLVFPALVTFPDSKKIWGHPALMSMVAWFLMALFLTSLWMLFHQPQGRALLVYFLCLVWATDIGAYACGKVWGRHKLIPKVSPGKTIEGTLGGMILAVLIAAAGLLYFHPSHPIVWISIGVLISGIAVIGDLFMSMLKRRVHLKDTGNLLPGHGGILDRLDSVIAAMPIFYFFVQNCSLC